jgi:hypothetical protein
MRRGAASGFVPKCSMGSAQREVLYSLAGAVPQKERDRLPLRPEVLRQRKLVFALSRL